MNGGGVLFLCYISFLVKILKVNENWFFNGGELNIGDLFDLFLLLIKMVLLLLF